MRTCPHCGGVVQDAALKCRWCLRPLAGPGNGIEPVFTHSGTRYVLGYQADFVGIWDREAPDGPERHPRTPEGWAGAWARFSAMEPRAEGVGPFYRAAATSAGVRRAPGLVAAAIALIVLGGLYALGGLFLATSADRVVSELQGSDLQVSDADLRAGLIVLGIALIAFGTLQIVAGALVIRRKRWARVLGIVMASIGLFFGLASLGDGSPVAGLVLLGVNVFVIVELARRGRAFPGGPGPPIPAP